MQVTDDDSEPAPSGAVSSNGENGAETEEDNEDKVQVDESDPEESEE